MRSKIYNTVYMSNSNHFNRILRPIIAGVVMLFAIGCIENQDIKGPEGDDVILSLRIDEVFKEKAYVRLNHDGSLEECWFHLLTEDLQTDAIEVLEDSLSKILDAGENVQVQKGVNKNLTFENLKAKTEYRVIASIINQDGSLAGNVAELRFKTLRDLDVFEEHPSWKIEYKERRVSKDDADQESEIFSCSVGDSKDTYVPCLLSKADFKNSYNDNLRSCFEDYVAFRNQENVKWHNVVLAEDCEHVEDRLRSGDYLVFMVGIDSLGTLTGYYAKEEFAIKQDPASAEYRAWIGKWNLKGVAGDKEVVYEVEIKPEENNLYLRMYGWENATASQGFEDFTAIPAAGEDQNHLSVLLYFSKATNDVYIVSEELAPIPDYAGIYYFYLYGCIEVDYEGVMTPVPVDIPNMRIARFSLNAAKNRATATPEPFIMDVGGMHYDTEFIYFNYSYIFPAVYQGLVPVTLDTAVPKISSLVLEK